jgi:hypothetical protein
MPKKNNQSKRVNSRSSGRRTAIPHPPPNKPEIRVTKTFRFVAGAARSDQALTFAELLNQLEVATTATTTVRLINAVRLIKLEIWAAVAQGAAPSLLQITGSGGGPGSIVSDTQMGVEPAHVVWRPPKTSRAALWGVSAVDDATVLCEYTCPVNAVIDVTMEMVLLSAIVGGPATAGSVPVGAAVGALYCDYLDGISLAHVAPEDYPTLP